MPKKKTHHKKHHPHVLSKKKKGFDEKKVLISIIAALVLSIVYLSLTSLFVNNVDKSIQETARVAKNIPSLEVSSFDVNTDFVSVNGVSSPNINLVFDTNKPTIFLLEIRGKGFFRRISQDKYSANHDFNLLLPNNMVGEEVNLKIFLYDDLQRQKVVSRNYLVPTIKSPSVSIT
ncbi:hypothetical protein GOV05_00700 [Candidatus Woesearchaeota archaeon]|nr:hypothetical protein [Candidatus Woesearchaeota archaeon]